MITKSKIERKFNLWKKGIGKPSNVNMLTRNVILPNTRYLWEIDKTEDGCYYNPLSDLIHVDPTPKFQYNIFGGYSRRDPAFKSAAKRQGLRNGLEDLEKTHSWLKKYRHNIDFLMKKERERNTWVYLKKNTK